MSAGIQKPLVSVVMPVKSCNALFLEKSIESILKQTLTNFELLLVVDAMDFLDRPLLRVLEKFKNDERLHVVPNKHGGFVEALNIGLSTARGKYIARMDSDDVSLTNRLELQIDFIEKENVDFVGGWAYVINEQGETVGRLTPPTDTNTIRRVIMIHNPFLHSSVTFKKSILYDSGLYNEALFGAEDYDLWLRLISLGYVCTNLPRFVLLLREASNSIVRGNSWKRTRASYAKAKVMGLTRGGYYDPISITSCFAGPFSSFVGPRTAQGLKFFLRWFSKTSSNDKSDTDGF